MLIIIEIILSILVDFIAPIFMEFLIELGFSKLRVLVNLEKKPSSILPYLSCFSSGIVLGAISYLIIPFPVFQRNYIPGISLIVFPIAAGGVMNLWGNYQESKNKVSSLLSTFWGGAIFGFGYALMRFVILNIL